MTPVTGASGSQVGTSSTWSRPWPSTRTRPGTVSPAFRPCHNRRMAIPEVLPFTALVGQEPMKTALVLNAINPAIGDVLIRGERGTAKSTAVRALAGLLPAIDVVAGCRFSCSPLIGDLLCDECRARQLAGEHLPLISRPMRVVDLPINASEDRLVGSIDIERAIKEGERSFD